MFFKSNKLIGLDIGTSSLKAAELEITAGRIFTLRSFGFAPTPGNSVAVGDIIDPSLIADAIKGLVSKLKTNRKKMAAGIWGTSVVIKKISVPKMDPKILQQQIKWEAEQYIPSDINEIHLEYAILPGTESSDNMEILLIAARSEYVYKFVDTIESAGFECSILDVNSLALANCFEVNYGVQNHTVTILNIGASITSLVVVDRGRVIFSREIPFGGYNFTTDIHKNLGVSIDEAEGLKFSASAGQPVPPQVNEILQQSTTVFVEEVQRSLNFYSGTTSDANIEKIYITGGGMGVPGLIAAVTQSSGIEVEIFNTFQKIKYDSRKFTSDYISQITPYAAIALGLAIRQVGDT